MDIITAKNAFANIMNSLSHEDRSQFLKWCGESFIETNSQSFVQSQSYFDLRVIAEDIKSKIPTEAILPTENIDHSAIENSSDGTCKPILHVDSFLYEEEHIDALEDEGKIKRNYCEKCGSFNVAPITFISHSMSIKRMQHLFQNMLPDLQGKVFLDVGSRLGAILYGAYHLSSAQKIIGVEKNEDFCNLQKHIVDQYSLNDRIEIICNDICNVPEVIQSANVIMFNNVFQCFLPLDVQTNVWIWLRNVITKPGTIIITVPSMEETLSNLKTGIDIATWLRKIPVHNSSMDDADDPDLLVEICQYAVL